MPSSLRLAIALVALSAAVGVAAVAIVYRQDDARARVNAEQMARGNADAGKAAIARYGCGACHRIDGVPGARGQVGPSLEGFAARAQIAGRLPNAPDALVRWIRDPQGVDPGNGMPNVGVTERDAHDIAAYLYTLRPSS